MTSTKTPLGYRAVCLYCGEKYTASNYNCSCSDKQWQDEYRTLALEFDYLPGDKRRIKNSFEDYNLSDNLGMLQYEALPGLSFVKEDELKVGNTPLLALNNLADSINNQTFIKVEGHNPSGCFKDRETMMCLLNSRKLGLDSAVIYSSGNAAASAAVFAQHHHMHLITFVSGDTYREKIDFIKDRGADVIVIGDDHTNFEEGYRIFCRINAENQFLKAGYDNWAVTNPYRTQGDKTMAVEIIKQLSDEHQKTSVPDYVIIPTANGSCMAGVYRGFKELFDLNLIDHIPKMVSVGIKNANPVAQAVNKQQYQKPEACDLSHVNARDAKIGSIILAEEGYDSIQAALAVEQTNGLALELTRKDIEELYLLLLDTETELMQEEDIIPEPASVLPIAAAKKLADKSILLPTDTVVAVVTGSGLKAKQKIQEIMADQPDAWKIAEEILARKRKQQYPKDTKKGREVAVPAQKEKVIEAFNKLTK